MLATPNFVIDLGTHAKHKNPQEHPYSVKSSCFISLKKILFSYKAAELPTDIVLRNFPIPFIM